MNAAVKAPKKVTVTPADPKYTQKDIRKQHLRVAPYCRVSTGSEEQQTSFTAQMEYYTQRIADTEGWTMVRLYADDSDIFEPSQKVLAKPSVFLIWSNFLSFWANIHGGVAWDIFFLPVILREGAEKQLLY